MNIVQVGPFPLSADCIRGGVESSVFGLVNELSKNHVVDVFDYIKGSGRSFGEGITPTMCEPPLILWANEEYKKVSNLHVDESVPTCTDDIIHGIMDLCGVKYHLYDSTKSIFHSSYLPKERIVQGLKYDNLKEKYLSKPCE